MLHNRHCNGRYALINDTFNKSKHSCITLHKGLKFLKRNQETSYNHARGRLTKIMKSTIILLIYKFIYFQYMLMLLAKIKMSAVTCVDRIGNLFDTYQLRLPAIYRAWHNGMEGKSLGVSSNSLNYKVALLWPNEAICQWETLSRIFVPSGRGSENNEESVIVNTKVPMVWTEWPEWGTLCQVHALLVSPLRRRQHMERPSTLPRTLKCCYRKHCLYSIRNTPVFTPTL